LGGNERIRYIGKRRKIEEWLEGDTKYNKNYPS
jgi:hypothetical protein